jgi:hypothetical protein
MITRVYLYFCIRREQVGKRGQKKGNMMRRRREVGKAR